MNHAQPKQYLAATHRAVANAESIEWEELPSLVDSLAQRLVWRGANSRGPAWPPGANESAFMDSTGFGSPWASTVSASLDPVTVSPPFDEPLRGLATREVYEPGVFRHFFGPHADAR